MHIAFLTPEYSCDEERQGGLGNYLRKVGLELYRRGHRVSILCLAGENAEWDDHGIQVKEIKRFRFCYKLMRLRPMYPYLMAMAQIRSAGRLGRELLKLHSSSRVDIAQASSYGAPGYTVRRNRQIPLVCRISSYTPMLRSACGQQRTFGDLLADWLEVRQALDARASFTPSDFVADNYARLEGYRPLTIRTPATLEPIDLDSSFYDRHLRQQEYLLYFGTFNRIKGVDLLSPVIRTVLDRHPSIKFVFVGRDHGFGNGCGAVEALRNANPAHQARLFFHPSLPKAQLYPVIGNAVGVLMPSRVDNYPNACLEAQALGVPVVGTCHSSLEEMVEEGVTGFLARNGDAKSFGDATERLLVLSPTKREQMRQSILSVTAARVAEDRVGQLIELYARVARDFPQKSQA